MVSKLGILVELVGLGKTAHLGPHPKSVAQHPQGHTAEYQCQIYMRKMNKSRHEAIGKSS